MEELITSDFKLGILGGGQLGKMLALAASNWDVNTMVLDPSSHCPAAGTCNSFVQGDFTSFDVVYEFGEKLDVITIELENVNADALIKLKEEGKKIYPDPEKLKLIQDKGLQKGFYAQHGFPSAAFCLYGNADEIRAAVKDGDLSLPFVQKTRKEGYDGKGVHIVKREADLQDLLEGGSIVEDKINVVKEIAVIVCRSTTGEVRSFPPVEMEFNSKANLVESLFCPSSLDQELQNQAVDLAENLIQSFDIEGILAVEMFLDESDNLLINEVAPRLHNSGHHTIESAFTSQYEQHLRAIFGLPLGSTEQKLPSVMINILGEPGYNGAVKYEGLEKCMAIEGIKLHIYGKKITKPYRKMGHATILDRDMAKAMEKAKFVKQNLKVKA